MNVNATTLLSKPKVFRWKSEWEKIDFTAPLYLIISLISRLLLFAGEPIIIPFPLFIRSKSLAGKMKYYIYGENLSALVRVKFDFKERIKTHTQETFLNALAVWVQLWEDISDGRCPDRFMFVLQAQALQLEMDGRGTSRQTAVFIP